MRHVFNEAGAKRVVAAVRRVERAAAPVGRQFDHEGVDATPPFWVELVAEDPANPGRYSWKYLNPEDGALVEPSPAVTSSTSDPVELAATTVRYSAREINGGPGLAGQKAEIKFVGYDVGGAAAYFFSGPSVVRVRIDSARTGNAWYKGYVWNRPTAAAATGTNATEATAGTQGVEVSALNLQELVDSQTGHDLVHADNAGQRIFIGHSVGQVDEAARPVIHLGGVWVDPCV